MIAEQKLRGQVGDLIRLADDHVTGLTPAELRSLCRVWGQAWRFARPSGLIAPDMARDPVLDPGPVCRRIAQVNVLEPNGSYCWVRPIPVRKPLG